MQQIIERLLLFAKEYRLFNADERLLLAVSGGKDSVFMARLFNEAGITFGIAHCNFQLRGQESDDDEAFVRTLAGSYNAPFFSTGFDTSEFAAQNQVSIQMAARNLRYDWLEKTRAENDYSVIAVAHHQNDTVETILLNLVRGTGLSGLHGILPKRGNIIRPLLFLKREEIDSLVSEYALAYREDSSNASSKYARNKIRLEVIPKLKELNPALEETFKDAAKRFTELELYLEKHFAALRSSLFQEQTSGEISISLEELKKSDLAPPLLFELFKPYGFSETVLSDLSKSWDGIPGKVFHSASHVLLLDREKLLLRALKQNDSAVSVVETDIAINFNGSLIEIDSVAAIDLELEPSPNKAYIDTSLLIYPLEVRSWQQGDVF